MAQFLLYRHTITSPWEGEAERNTESNSEIINLIL